MSCGEMIGNDLVGRYKKE